MDATVIGPTQRAMSKRLSHASRAFRRIFVMRLIRPHPEYPATSSETLTAEAAKPVSKVTDARQKHLDYNLQPLSVDSFSHYIDAVVDDDRFRVR
jgi:hypothetical protein